MADHDALKELVGGDDINMLQRLIGHGGIQAFRHVPLALKKVMTERQWQTRLDRDGRPFASFEAFVTAKLQNGLESSIDDLLAFCRKAPDVQRLIKETMEPGPSHADAGARGGRGHKASDNVTGFRGNSSLYTMKRLKRDRPDLFQAVLDGTLSANAAAIAAGWRSKPTPLAQVLKLIPKLTDAEWKRVMAARREGK